MGAAVTIPPRRDVCKTITGIYVGNSADNRNIDIGVDLAAKSNPTVIVKVIGGAQLAIFREEHGQGDSSYQFTTAGAVSDRIQQFNSTGFQVGTHTAVNLTAISYLYIVFWTEY